MSEQTVLEEAAAAVAGARQDDYGHPSENFGLIADLWSAALGFEFTPAQVAILNILQKVARELHRPKRDNRVDIAGYAETLEMVAERDTAPDEAASASYPDIVDGDGDTWEFHHLYRGVPQYVMRHGDGVPRDAEYIHDQYPPRHPDEIVDGDGSKWTHVGDGEYTFNVGPNGELSTGTLVRKTPEFIYERYGRPAA